jgi:anti-sigma factor RsiW
MRHSNEPAESADDELLLIAAWLDGNLDERRAAAIEARMADDRELLERVLALREFHSEPVAAAELQRAQALVQAKPPRPPLREQLVNWLRPARGWQPAPMAMGAALTVAVMAGSLWFGTLASQELSGEDFQSASQLEITMLDFNSSDVE